MFSKIGESKPAKKEAEKTVTPVVASKSEDQPEPSSTESQSIGLTEKDEKGEDNYSRKVRYLTYAFQLLLTLAMFLYFKYKREQIASLSSDEL